MTEATSESDKILAPGTLLRPTHLGRFVVLLESAGYSRCSDAHRNLRDKEYRVTEHGLELQGVQGWCEFFFDDSGSLTGHEILEWA